MNFNSEIPVSKAILDQHDLVNKKIEAANDAVLDAILTICKEVDDPVAMNLLGVDANFLKTVMEAKNKIKAMGMTGVPLWSVRFATEDISVMAKSNASCDSMFKSLLQSFSKDLTLRSI